MMTFSDPHGHRMRWCVALSSLDFTVHYSLNLLNPTPAALSRCTSEDPQSESEPEAIPKFGYPPIIEITRTSITLEGRFNHAHGSLFSRHQDSDECSTSSATLFLSMHVHRPRGYSTTVPSFCEGSRPPSQRKQQTRAHHCNKTLPQQSNQDLVGAEHIQAVNRLSIGQF